MTLVDEKGRRRLPPYVSYRSFRNFLDELQRGIPSRIDRSFWGERLSGSTGTQLVAALRFLGLIDATSAPTNRLRSLVHAKGAQRTELFRQMTSECFGFLLSAVDPQNATYAQIEEVLHRDFQLTGDVSRKCIKFFVAIAADSGMDLSSFITKRVRLAYSSAGTKAITKRKVVRTNPGPKIPDKIEVVPDGMPWDKLLLSKFPAFDPTWPDEVKLNWFKAFDELLRMWPGPNSK